MDISSVRKSVEEANRNLGSALARKSYPDVAALYTEHAKVLAPDAPIVTGREAIERFWRETATAGGILGAALKTLDLEVAGDTAYEVGEAALTLTSGKGPTVTYVVVWKRGGDSAWRIHRISGTRCPRRGNRRLCSSRQARAAAKGAQLTDFGCGAHHGYWAGKWARSALVRGH